MENNFDIEMKHANNNEIFIDEHKRFTWDEKTLDSDNPQVIAVDDHTCDQFIYLCLDNAKDFKLKV